MDRIKRARVNKNKKKSWKKHIDVKEIEEFLEDQRHDERLGGPLQDKPDNSIFFLQKERQQTTAKNKSKLKKPLRCFQILQPDSVVPPPITPGRTRSSSKMSAAVADRKRLILQKRLQHKIDRSKLKKNRAAEKLKNINFDMWSESNEPASAPSKTRKTVKVPPFRYQKPSLLPSVEVPHAGMSYNPTFEAHQELLSEAHMVEVKKVIAEQKLNNRLTDKFPTASEAPSEMTWLEEMSQGLFEESDNESEGEDVNDALKFSCIVQENRKPKAKKRREKEQKLKERTLLEAKTEKRRLNNIYKLRHIKKEIVEAEEKYKERVREKSRKEIEKMYQPRKICKHKYQAPDLELNLRDELAGSLRTVKVEGNLLEDRYKSFQRRNIIEPRIRQKMKRKYKKKVFEKKGHKNVK